MAFDLQIMAATVLMEASAEPTEGQRAVAHVIANRVRDGRWGRTYAAVCLKAEQFSCWNTSDPNRTRLSLTPDSAPYLEAIVKMVQDVMVGSDADNTGGALYYFNPKLCFPEWANRFTKIASIGSHEFYTDKTIS